MNKPLHETSDKKSCDYKGRTYRHGSMICEQDRCITCNDGVWEDKTWPSSSKS